MRRYLIDGHLVTHAELVQDNEGDDEFIDFVESLDVGEEAAWGMPEGWGQASFDIVRLPDDDEWLHNPLTVWRIENEQGKGPYTSGGARGQGPERSLPIQDFPTAGDAPAEWWERHRGWRFGFRTKQDALAWFGPHRLEALARKGYRLVPKQAALYEPSSTGRQIIYMPEDMELSAAEKTKILGEKVYDEAEREGWKDNDAHSMQHWAMAYEAKDDKDKWPFRKDELRFWLASMRPYMRSGDTSWRQAWDRRANASFEERMRLRRR